ncbi:probable mediator of RNA polymerase II transcription subunit 26c isoform X2 [Magnolia sinica]|uniref:probable mediator of RNA polymerase II transcription subunit 26c isoform X2 n=1 Tax=Magnolia sinica TaxID=86752 RepID=UPI00265B3C80|nr:probable mediator of RNA polymerase II transcription subunit 26c isoform X2 [Magnolia sinica]
MDLDDFRSILRDSGVDVWTMIETAISMASADYGKELKDRRDGIVERLYSPAVHRCHNCDLDAAPRLSNTGIEENEKKSQSSVEKESSSGGNVKGASPLTMPRPMDGEDDQDQIYEGGHSIDHEKNKILVIKEHLEDPGQSDDSLVDLLQGLADMDITFTALKETDIGRHVNGLRKHPSSEVRRLVKQLVRKWKDLVDEWVKLRGETAAAAVIDGDSPQQFSAKSNQNGNQVSPSVPDFGYSPNCHNGSSGSEKYNPQEPETKGKGIPRREVQMKQSQSVPPASSVTSNKQKESKESLIDPERLASARRRLHENYQEAQNGL